MLIGLWEPGLRNELVGTQNEPVTKPRSDGSIAEFSRLLAVATVLTADGPFEARHRLSF